MDYFFSAIFAEHSFVNVSGNTTANFLTKKKKKTIILSKAKKLLS